MPGAPASMAVLGFALFFLGTFLFAVSTAMFAGCLMIIFGMAYTYALGLQDATPLLAERVIDTLVGALIAGGVIVLLPLFLP